MSEQKKPAYNYDRTAAQRQAKRRRQFMRMRRALVDIIADPEATEGLRAKARAALCDDISKEKAN